MTSVSSNPLLKDLKLTLQSHTLVYPSQQTEKKFINLSCLDRMANFNVKEVNFFPANPDFPLEIVFKRFKMALEKVLVQYDFMVGRVKFNHHLGHREINCNAAGVGLVKASSAYTLEEIGDLVCPNLGFCQLVQNLDNLAPNEDQPLCIFQVTTFKCGGFAFGVSMLHVLFDGIAWKIFLENLASQAFDDDRPLAIIPDNNRRLLAPRSSPVVKFIPTPEILKPRAMSSEELEYKFFKFRANDINFLKEKAKSRYSTNINTGRISRFNLVAALIWRCKVMSSCNIDLGDKTSTLFSVVDLRPRLSPALSMSYSGNAMLAAYSLAKCKEIEKGPFGKLVELVLEGPKRMTDEYARSMIDWFETTKPRIHGDYMW